MRMRDEDFKCKSALDPVMFHAVRLVHRIGDLCLVSQTVKPHLAFALISSLAFLLPLINLNSFLHGMPPLPQIPCPLIAEVLSLAATPSDSYQKHAQGSCHLARKLLIALDVPR